MTQIFPSNTLTIKLPYALVDITTKENNIVDRFLALCEELDYNAVFVGESGVCHPVIMAEELNCVDEDGDLFVFEKFDEEITCK